MTGRSFVLAIALCAVASLASATGGWAQGARTTKTVPGGPTPGAHMPGGPTPGAHPGGGLPTGHGGRFHPRIPFGFGGVVIQPSYAEPYEPVTRVHRPRSHAAAHRPRPRSAAHLPGGVGADPKAIDAQPAFNRPAPGKDSPNTSHLPPAAAAPAGSVQPQAMPRTSAAAELPETGHVDCIDCGVSAASDCTWTNRTLWTPQGEVLDRVRYCGVK